MTGARCAAPCTTTETTTKQRPRSDYTSWDSPRKLGCLKPATACQCTNSWEVASTDWGPKTSNRKVLDPLLRIGDANSNAA